MSRTLLLEVNRVQTALRKLSAPGCAKAECPALPSSRPQPALPVGQGTGDKDAGSCLPARFIPTWTEAGSMMGKPAKPGSQEGVMQKCCDHWPAPRAPTQHNPGPARGGQLPLRSCRVKCVPIALPFRSSWKVG